jgi:hypothetical protein
MEYVFDTPIPLPWLVADIVTVLTSLLVVAFVIRKASQPVSVILEGFAFVFLYAGLFENFAVVDGWYVYGRSMLMFGDVPLSVPLIEMDVFLVGLWLLQKLDIPECGASRLSWACSERCRTSRLIPSPSGRCLP